MFKSFVVSAVALLSSTAAQDEEKDATSIYVNNADYQYERYYNWDPVTGDTEEKGYNSRWEGYYWNNYNATSNVFYEEYNDEEYQEMYTSGDTGEFYWEKEKDYGETYFESYDEETDYYNEAYIPGSALALSKKNKIKDSISKAVAVSLKSDHASQYKRSQDGGNSLGEDISLGYYYYSSYGYYDYYYGTYYSYNSTLDWGWFFLTLLCCPCVIWYWCCAAAASSTSSSTNTTYVSSTVHDPNGQSMQQPNYDPSLQMQQQNIMMGNQMQTPGNQGFGVQPAPYGAPVVNADQMHMQQHNQMHQHQQMNFAGAQQMQ